jgi:hypothetical protein
MILIAIGLLILAFLLWKLYKQFTSTVNTFTSPWQRLQNLFS